VILQSWRAQLAQTAERLTGFGQPMCRSYPVLCFYAVAIGCLPVLCLPFGASFHQILSTLAVAPGLWWCARENDWRKGMLFLASVFLAHSIVVIVITACGPDHGSAIVPGGTEYWRKQYEWITTGRDPEYEWKAWGPAHVQLFAGTTLFSVTSFGMITLHQGFYEVDLMNFYNGQLVLISRRPAVGLFYGWHLWSLLRGCGYIVLTFELSSLGLQLAIGRRLSPWKQRMCRFATGTGFLILDGVAKWSLLEIVRQKLAENLV
jgi:hypothetical protein